MTAAPMRLIVSNDLSELTRIAGWLNTWAEQQDVPPGTAARLDLCSTEAVTNIVLYGYERTGCHEISLTLRRDGAGVTLEIEDDGRAFDPREAAAPPRAVSLETAPIGGWGIPIIRRFADELRYCRKGDRNILSLVFRIVHLVSI